MRGWALVRPSDIGNKRGVPAPRPAERQQDRARVRLGAAIPARQAV